MTTVANYVLVMFVTAQPTGPAPAAHPNPPPQQAPGQGGSRTGRLLGLLTRLLLYGHDLTEKLHQCAGTPRFTLRAIPFGTTDLASILRRITRGLMLATLLYERLERRAARGRDITPSPLRVRSPGKPGPRPPRPQRAKPQAAPDVFELPTPEEIAAMVRRRPVGTVIVNICHDLGIIRGNVDPALWSELRAAIIDYGGSLARYLDRMMDRMLGPVPEPHSSPSPWRRGPGGGGREPVVETPQSSPPAPLALATGPP